MFILVYWNLVDGMFTIKICINLNITIDILKSYQDNFNRISMIRRHNIFGKKKKFV